MKVDMNLLKQLRQATLASMGECRKALIQAEGDMEKATQILKERGAAKAAKKADRETNEGALKIITQDDRVYMIKMFCETDFVAKNETFAELIEKGLAILTQEVADVTDIAGLTPAIAGQIDALLKDYVLKLGENIKLGAVYAQGGHAYAYNHNGGKLAAVVYYQGDEAVAKELALQVAAMAPDFVSMGDVPAATKDALAETAKAQLADSGKPADIIEKIVVGKVNKELQEQVLLEQVSIRDGSKKIKDILQGTTISAFERFTL